MAAYDARNEWTRFYARQEPIRKTYPNEYAVRIFMGSYPKLDLDKSAYTKQRICDVGCGDGRNIVLFHDLGLEVHGVEITEEIAGLTRERLKTVEGIDVEIRVGTNDDLPFEDGQFDYLFSWGACDCMGEQTDFGEHVREFARVLKPDGHFIALISQPGQPLFRNSLTLRPGYQLIQDDPAGVRNGEIVRMFRDEEEIRALRPFRVRVAG
jgi:SAM-dependent methyltransferase